MEKEFEKLAAKYTDEEKGRLRSAFEYADAAHKNQTRKSGEPYLSHPLRVAQVLSNYDIGIEVVIAGLLHDVIEESEATVEEIKNEFGEEVAFLVDSLTKLRDVDFVGEEELAENFRKMVLATAKDIRVVVIKLVDVEHNMETIDALPPDRQLRYAREVIQVYAPLAARLGMGKIKGHLEDLAFKVVHPKEYEDLEAQMREAMRESASYVDALTPKVSELLKREGVMYLHIDARVKHLYSLWKKLVRYDWNWDKVYDLVALRIIVPDIQTCYAALGALHKEWTPLPGRIKDFIALPKPSGYRSLHTSVFADEGRVTEFQIRTEEMHREAELGIAAHWAYKESGKGLKRNLAWISQLRDWQHAASTQEFLDTLRIDFFKDRIFVFTPKGDVIDLPEAATPVDFAYAVHSDLGDHCSLARVNGKAVSLSTELKNNDQVEIVTQKNKKPSSDWMKFVKTSKARAKIRDAMRT